MKLFALIIQIIFPALALMCVLAFTLAHLIRGNLSFIGIITITAITLFLIDSIRQSWIEHKKLKNK